MPSLLFTVAVVLPDPSADLLELLVPSGGKQHCDTFERTGADIAHGTLDYLWSVAPGTQNVVISHRLLEGKGTKHFKFAIDRKGIWLLGVAEGQTWNEYDAPEMQLPTPTVDGRRFHQVSQELYQSCEVAKSPLCAEGHAVQCIAARPAHPMETHVLNHYCPGQGIVASALSIWTNDVPEYDARESCRDGLAAEEIVMPTPSKALRDEFKRRITIAGGETL